MRIAHLLPALLLSVTLTAQTPLQPAAPTAPLNQNMRGDWAGQLEYRDFQTNERTFLPTWLTMSPAAAGNAVTLAYTYDDGPTKTVREQSALTFTPDGQTATVTELKSSGGPGEQATYTVTGMSTFRTLNRGTLILTGPGKENDKPVDTRLTLTLRRNLFTLLKETRPPGTGDFKFRDQYTMTRATPPAL